MPAKRISPKLRQQVMARAQGYCEYCRCPDSFSSDPFSVDHVVPKTKGGKTILGNLAYACQGCNGKKYNRMRVLDPLTKKRVGLYHPRIHCWAAHFAWNEDFSQIIGLSAIGRASVVALDLNRVGVVNLRRLLRYSNQHPPE